MFKLWFIFLAGSKLEQAIADGPEVLQRFIDSGQIEELHDVMPHNDDDYLNEAYLDEDDEDDDKSSQRSRKSDPPPAPIWERPPDLDDDMRGVYNIGGDRDRDRDRDHDRGRELDFRPPPPRGGPFDNNYHMRDYDDRPDMDYDYPDRREFLQRNGNGFFNQRNGIGLPPPPFLGNGNFQPPGFPGRPLPPPDFRGMNMGMNMMNRPRVNGNMRGGMGPRGNMPRPRGPAPRGGGNRGRRF